MAKIALSITEGRVIRDFFENGLLDLANQQGLEIICFTPAARVDEFVSKWSRPNVQFLPLYPYALRGRAYRGARLRDLLLKRGKWSLQLWRRLEPYFFRGEPAYMDAMKDVALAVITNPLFHEEMAIYSTALELGIPTVGVLRSWDNLYKGFRIRPDMLAVWNPVNRREAMDLMMYESEQVIMLGATQFDPYFDPDSSWSRERFAHSMGLDVNRPIITMATLGAFLPKFDETYLADILLEAIRTGQIDPESQLVIRLHPASKMEYFSKYVDMPDVRLSHPAGYIPTLGWTMTRDDVVFMANLLRHSDVVISPGSTITIETAIFDTPTIVPIFNAYQPELNKEQYDRHLSTHFKRLADLDLIPIVREPEGLISAINCALADKTWYREQRTQLVHDYIHFTDGRSVIRLVEWIVKLANQHNG
jgi:hypothetical protein